MKTFRIWYKTKFGIGFEKRTGKDKNSVISKLPKRLKNFFEIEEI